MKKLLYFVISLAILSAYSLPAYATTYEWVQQAGSGGFGVNEWYTVSGHTDFTHNGVAADELGYAFFDTGTGRLTITSHYAGSGDVYSLFLFIDYVTDYANNTGGLPSLRFDPVSGTLREMYEMYGTATFVEDGTNYSVPTYSYNNPISLGGSQSMFFEASQDGHLWDFDGSSDFVYVGEVPEHCA